MGLKTKVIASSWLGIIVLIALFPPQAVYQGSGLIVHRFLFGTNGGIYLSVDAGRLMAYWAIVTALAIGIRLAVSEKTGQLPEALSRRPTGENNEAAP